MNLKNNKTFWLSSLQHEAFTLNVWDKTNVLKCFWTYLSRLVSLLDVINYSYNIKFVLHVYVWV